MSYIKNLHKTANDYKYAMPAFNVINALMLKDVVEIADEEGAPVIIALSEAHLNHFSLEEAVNCYNFYKSRTKVPIILHLDHGQNISTIKKAIDLGFPSVMIDASKDSFDINVNKTKEIVDYASKKDVFVEAEIGHVGSNYGTSEASEAESKYTEVIDAVKFAELTKVDSLAVSVGTAHGEYKGKPHINFKRLKDISKNIKIPLVIHGGSSTGDDNLRQTIEFNVSKINIYTDVVVAAMNNINEFKTYEELMCRIDENMKVCLKHYINVFNTKRWRSIE